MVTTYSSIADEIKNISWKYASENIDDDLHTDILFMETSVSLLKKLPESPTPMAFFYTKDIKDASTSPMKRHNILTKL